MSFRSAMACPWRFLVVAAVTAGSSTGSAQAEEQPCEKDRNLPLFSGYTAYEENDSIIKDGGDERYTQGLRVEVSFHRRNTPCWTRKVDALLAMLPFRASHAKHDFALVLGQNLYTPRIITTTEIDGNDRSFSDFTYLGALFSATSNDQQVRHRLEVDAGVLGSPELAKGAQGGLHTLKMRRIPKGWDSTQPKRFGVNAYYRMEKRWAPGCDLGKQSLEDEPPLPVPGAEADSPHAPRRDVNCSFDLTYGYTGEAGSVRRSAGLHGSLRLGWRLTGFPSSTIQSGADRDTPHPLEAGVVVGFEPRRVFHTELVHATAGSKGFSLEKTVKDLRYGFYVRYESFRFSYQRVRRSAEFSVAGAKHEQEFASIAASYEPTLADAPDQDPSQASRPWLFRHWQFELGMGTAFRGPRVTIGGDRPVAAQLVARKALLRRGPVKVNLGLFEMAAGTVELGLTPGEPSNRMDLFLRQRAVTLGLTWSPLDGRAGQFGARAGTALWGSDARVQTVRHGDVPGGEEVEDVDYESRRGGLLVGFQYFLPLERHLSIGADVAYHDVRIDPALRGIVKDASFWKAVFLVQVRP